MRRPYRLAALATLAILAIGCARTVRTGTVVDGEEVPEQAVPAEPVVLYFVNSSTLGADVYVAVNERDERRLGTVQPGGTGRFVLPPTTIRLGSTLVIARLHPSTRRLRTGQLTVNSGDEITVSLPLAANTLSVRGGRP